MSSNSTNTSTSTSTTLDGAVRDLLFVNKATAGRDKIFRIAQYFCRFYGWVLSDDGTGSLQASHPIKALESHLALARKLMRLLTSLDHFLDARASRRVDPAKDEPVLDQVLLFLTHTNKGLRMTFDHVQWACALRLFGARATASIKDPASKAANLFWLAGLLTSLCRSYRRSRRIWRRIDVLHSEYKAERLAAKALRASLQRQNSGSKVAGGEDQKAAEEQRHQEQSRADSDNEASNTGGSPSASEGSGSRTNTGVGVTPTWVEEDEQELEQVLRRKDELKQEILGLRDQYIAVVLDMAREVCDLPVPAHALSMIPKQTTGMVGFFGTISSVIGLYQVWTRVIGNRNSTQQLKQRLHHLEQQQPQQHLHQAQQQRS